MRSININGYNVEFREDKTDIFGLSFLPQMTEYDNDEDWSVFTRGCKQEVSPQNFNLVKEISKNYMTHGIMEIGVSRNGMASFTQAMFQSKPDHIKYLGIDLDDKTYLDNKDKNIFTIRENSYNRDSVKKYLNEIGLEKISILFIDGWHSVNAVINDWQYVDMLSDNGIVIFHDTNYHPGPTIFLEAIDGKIFKVEKYFENEDDYGVSIAYRLK
jgi:hypothetical protein